MSTPAAKAASGVRKSNAAEPSTPAQRLADDKVKRLEEDITMLRKHVASPIAHPYGHQSTGMALKDDERCVFPITYQKSSF
jgi:hypothetical protein